MFPFLTFIFAKSCVLHMHLPHEFHCSYYRFSLSHSLLCPALGNVRVYFLPEWETVTILLRVMEGFEPFLTLPALHQYFFQKSLFYQYLRFGSIL